MPLKNKGGGRKVSRYTYPRLYDSNREITYLYIFTLSSSKFLHPLTIGRKRVGGRENSRIPGPASDHCPGPRHGPCLFARVLPVCQDRSVRYPLTWYSHKQQARSVKQCPLLLSKRLRIYYYWYVPSQRIWTISRLILSTTTNCRLFIVSVPDL